jgi:cytochrome c-type biogenesis protein
VLSFLSPCVLPLVPTYLAYVGGSGARGARMVLRNAACSCSASAWCSSPWAPPRARSARVLREHRAILMVVGGVLVIAFGSSCWA